MSKRLYRVINPVVKKILRSPLHGVLSPNTLLLEFTGRKSGRKLSTPVSYHSSGGVAHCFTRKSFVWWKNLNSGEPVYVTIKGKRHLVNPEVEAENSEIKGQALRHFLRAVPRDAPHSGVSLDTNGDPSVHDIHRVVSDMVYVRLPLPD
jgi:hypothetical protein